MSTPLNTPIDPDFRGNSGSGLVMTHSDDYPTTKTPLFFFEKRGFNFNHSTAPSPLCAFHTCKAVVQITAIEIEE